MEDKHLKMISLAIAVAGALGLAVISLQNEYTPANIYEINEKMLGKKIYVNGTVISFSETENAVFMTLENGGRIKAVFFDRVYAKKGSNAVVYGKVNIYKNELEIVGEKIIAGDID